jgi:hypothetical protein
MSVANSHLPSPGWKAFSSGSAASTLTMSSLYPFADGYGVYAGACEAHNPAQYDSDYFSTIGTAAFTIPPPDGTATVTVREPALNVQVVTGASNTPVAGATVKVTTADADCTETYPTQTTDATGAMPDPSFPFGKFDVCVSGGGRRNTALGVLNTSPDGVTPVRTISLSGTGSTLGSC